MITVLEELAVDYEITARVATEAFGSKDVVFSAQRMKWLYESGFGQGSAIIAVCDDGKKIGQIALLHQKVYLDGKPAAATQLIDLFILRSYRSPQLVRRIYQEVERLCQAEGIHLVLALPNEKSTPLNERFMKLRPFLSLPALIPDRGRILVASPLKPETFRPPQIDAGGRGARSIVRLRHPGNGEWTALGRRDLVQPHE
jgi:acetyltransferase (GNAT) family protein